MYDLEAYFTGLGTDDIRLAGHRVGIDDVLTYHVQGMSALTIQTHLPSLRLDEIYATLTYYYVHQAALDAYMARLAQWRDDRYGQWLADPTPSPVVARLRAIKAQQEPHS